MVFGEKAKLRQVFLNLLSNAVKFTERGGAIRVAVDDSGDRAQVEIADTASA